MKMSQSFPQLSAGLLVFCCLVGCKDLEKLLGNNETAKPESVAIEAVKPPATVSVEKMPAALPKLCSFSQSEPPENIEVYAVDGQAWIDTFKQTNRDPATFATITINIDNAIPTALLLTAKQAAVWQIKPSKRTKLWGVYVTADARQIIAGAGRSALLQQHYSSLNDACGFYWSPELQVQELYGFSKKLFGKPYIALANINNGIVDIQEIAPVANTTAINRELSDGRAPALTSAPLRSEPAANKPKAMSINEALRANLIRPGSLADVQRFKSRYLAVNQQPVPKDFEEHISMMPIYVINIDFTYPEGLYGAHAAVFIIENGVPYPLGDPGHSQVLDMKSGTCLGRPCR